MSWGLACVIVAGAVVIILGIIACMGNISIIHWYNRTKVSPENQVKYARLIGIGTIIIGISFVVTGIIQFIHYLDYFWFIILAGVIVGLGFVLYSQFKYNKGIF